MTYAVKEIYYTLQGEGANSGRPAVFLRFSGCNLWTGLDKDRSKGPGGCSAWCDTNFVGTDGPGGGKFKSAEDLALAVVKAWPLNCKGSAPLVVCTGGEPLLQLDKDLLSSLYRRGFSVAVESNGTIKPPDGPIWLTISPKAGARLVVKRGRELKLAFPQAGAHPNSFADLDFDFFYLQPIDDGNITENTRSAVEYCLAHPKWRLSLQTHKILGLA